jgi:hypothetical protein
VDWTEKVNVTANETVQDDGPISNVVGLAYNNGLAFPGNNHYNPSVLFLIYKQEIAYQETQAYHFESLEKDHGAYKRPNKRQTTLSQVPIQQSLEGMQSLQNFLVMRVSLIYS